MDVGQYATEVQAKPVCGSDKTVWEDPNTGQLYQLTDKHDRNTNDGTYVCKSFALDNGYGYGSVNNLPPKMVRLLGQKIWTCTHLTCRQTRHVPGQDL
jgi:hypothetical protein